MIYKIHNKLNHLILGAQGGFKNQKGFCTESLFVLKAGLEPVPTLSHRRQLNFIKY